MCEPGQREAVVELCYTLHTSHRRRCRARSLSSRQAVWLGGSHKGKRVYGRRGEPIWNGNLRPMSFPARFRPLQPSFVWVHTRLLHGRSDAWPRLEARKPSERLLRVCVCVCVCAPRVRRLVTETARTGGCHAQGPPLIQLPGPEPSSLHFAVRTTYHRC